VTSAARNILRHAGQIAAGAVPATLLARLGLPALVAVVSLAIAALAMTCWVLSSEDRTNRVSQIILARRGQPTIPAAASPAQAMPRNDH
jgi:hypothetical protein